MKTFLQTWFFLLATLFLGAACEEMDTVAPIDNCMVVANDDHPLSYRYQNILEAFTAAGAPGVSVAVISPEGRWAGAAGSADLAQGTPLTPCHSLRIGSASKTLTAAAILQLHDDGIIDIDEPAANYLPHHITDRIENANVATIRQLLNHGAGIREHLGAESYLNIVNHSEVRHSAEERLESIYDKKAPFAAGTDMQYSNSNYLLLALVLQYATGAESGYAVVRDRLLTPLAMTATFAGTDEPAGLTRGYFDIYDNGHFQDLTEIDNHAVGGENRLDGGFISSAIDLARFMNELYKGNLLSRQTLDEMTDFVPITEDIGFDVIKNYGLGMMEIETPYGRAGGHYGGVHCFSSAMFHFPEQEVTVAIILNGNSKHITELLYSEEPFNLLFED